MIFPNKTDLSSVHSDDDERISFKISELEIDSDQCINTSLSKFNAQKRAIEDLRKEVLKAK